MHQFDLTRSSLLQLHGHGIKQRHKQRRTFLPKSGGLSFSNRQGVGLSDARSLACMHIARSAQPLQASPASPISHIRPPFPAFVVAVRCDLYISIVRSQIAFIVTCPLHTHPSFYRVARLRSPYSPAPLETRASAETSSVEHLRRTRICVRDSRSPNDRTSSCAVHTQPPLPLPRLSVVTHRTLLRLGSFSLAGLARYTTA
jgi:hypothetical protein